MTRIQDMYIYFTHIYQTLALGGPIPNRSRNILHCILYSAHAMLTWKIRLHMTVSTSILYMYNRGAVLLFKHIISLYIFYFSC